MTPPNVFIVVSARMASSRYPAKALALLAGRPLLEVLFERLRALEGYGLVLATSTNPENAPLVELAERLGVTAFRGEEDDVLRRHIDCAHSVGAEHVVRVTGDNPLTDTETLEKLVRLHLSQAADYTYVPGDALLMGILSEVISTRALEISWERGEARHRSELVTLYIKEHPEQFRIALGTLAPDLYRPDLRLTVDEPEDVELMQRLFEHLTGDGPRRSGNVQTREAIECLSREPGLARINAHLTHRAANLRSVALDRDVTASSGIDAVRRGS